VLFETGCCFAALLLHAAMYSLWHRLQVPLVAQRVLAKVNLLLPSREALGVCLKLILAVCCCCWFILLNITDVSPTSSCGNMYSLLTYFMMRFADVEHARASRYSPSGRSGMNSFSTKASAGAAMSSCQ
jgi:hypothetical protein